MSPLVPSTRLYWSVYHLRAGYKQLILQAKAFETNNDQDNEETNELDDDELNELLARGDHELEIFAKMDRDREALRRERFAIDGNKGELPPTLMAEDELPPFYRIDIGDHLASQVVNDEDQGRGRRARAEVKYSDGLTDDQWLTAMDASDDDVDAAVGRKQQAGDRKKERKRLNEMLAQAEAEGKPMPTIRVKRDTSVSVGDAGTPPPKAIKKRGRPSKSATPSVMGEDGPTVSLTLISFQVHG
jgi:ATP-dependent helicase STH1/SNF2